MGSNNRRPSHNHSHRVNRSVKRSHQNERPFQSATPRESIQCSQMTSVQPLPTQSALERTVNRLRIIVATPFIFFSLALLAPHEVIPTFQELFGIDFKEGTLPL